MLIPVLCYIGTGLKRSRKINDKYIPLVLGAIGIFLAALWTFATCPCGCLLYTSKEAEESAKRGEVGNCQVPPEKRGDNKDR